MLTENSQPAARPHPFNTPPGMSPQPLPIVQNTTYLTAALVIQKALSLIFFLLIAHTLGGGRTGDYVAAFSLSSIFAVFTDLGLGSVLVRELARDRSKSADYLGNVVTVRLGLSVAAYVALVGFVKLLDARGAGHPPFELVAIAGAVMVVDSFTLVATSVFRGWQNLWFESVVIAVSKALVLGLGAAVLYAAPSTLNVMLAVLGGSVVSLVLLTRYLSRQLALTWRPRWNAEIARRLGRLAAPFALAGAFSALYAYSDSVLLSILKGSEAVGIYSVASKTMNAFQFIPSAFMAAVYPAMSGYYQSSPERLQRTLEESLRYLLLISAPVAVGLYLLADAFVARLGPGYAPAAAAVRILMPSLVFVFLSFPLGALLNASNRQHWQTSVIGAGMGLNVAFNIWLIPRWSYLGASWAWFVTNAVVLVLGFGLARVVVRYDLVTLGRSLLRTAVASAAMWLAAESAMTRVPLAGVVAVGALVYLAALFLVRELTRRDVAEFYRLFRPAEFGALDRLAPPPSGRVSIDV